jgi:hypothetical protein
MLRFFFFRKGQVQVFKDFNDLKNLSLLPQITQISQMRLKNEYLTLLQICVIREICGNAKLAA